MAAHSVAAQVCDATTAATTTAAGPPKKNTPPRQGVAGYCAVNFLKSFFGFWCNAPVNAF
jgi:hypothetical protein